MKKKGKTISLRMPSELYDWFKDNTPNMSTAIRQLMQAEMERQQYEDKGSVAKEPEKKPSKWEKQEQYLKEIDGYIASEKDPAMKQRWKEIKRNLERDRAAGRWARRARR